MPESTKSSTPLKRVQLPTPRQHLSSTQTSFPEPERSVPPAPRPALPVVEWLEVSSLRVDHAYQHRPYVRAVADLKRHFNPDVSGFILVNRRADGSLWVLDGQTRCAVHEDIHLPWIRAEVLQGLSQQQEADVYLFKCKNTQRVPVDYFLAEYTAGHAQAVLIYDILAKHAIAVESFATEHQTRQGHHAVVTCVKALRDTLREDQEGTHLNEALDLILATWGYGKAGLSGQIIKIMYTLVKRHGEELDRKSFIAKLGGHTVPELRAMAQQLRYATTPNLTESTAILRKIVELYNIHRLQGRRIALGA